MPLQQEEENSESFLLSIFASMPLSQVAGNLFVLEWGVLLPHPKRTLGCFGKIKVGRFFCKGVCGTLMLGIQRSHAALKVEAGR